MDDQDQVADGKGQGQERGPLVSGCCVAQLVALLGCVWTGISLGVRYAHGDPLLVGAGKVALGLVLGLVGGILAALLLLFLDHVSSEWALRRHGESPAEEDQPGPPDPDAEP